MSQFTAQLFAAATDQSEFGMSLCALGTAVLADAGWSVSDDAELREAVAHDLKTAGLSLGTTPASPNYHPYARSIAGRACDLVVHVYSLRYGPEVKAWNKRHCDADYFPPDDTAFQTWRHYVQQRADFYLEQWDYDGEWRDEWTYDDWQTTSWENGAKHSLPESFYHEYEDSGDLAADCETYAKDFKVVT